tara:strand:+ start:433 stop:678 length:246 start_codon:yes stop_codon:yes gene_type:complete
MILENNLVFSLTLSFVITVIYYFITNDNNNKFQNETEKRNQMILLFGICFIISFGMKFSICNNKNIKSGENLLTHNSRPPF